jgi:hypothetical protein
MLGDGLDAGVESASKFTGAQLAALVKRDESLREKSDDELQRFAEDANSNFDNWLDKKADEGEDWNEWSMADAAEFMEAFEAMIRVRKVALLEDVRRAVNSNFVNRTPSERDGHEPPFQVGSVLEYDVEVVPWVPDMHEENVAVQVWMKEWGDADNNCAGWEPRAIAQIARERGITNVTNRDLQDILDDPDISKIAFRPDTSITTLIKQINDLNSKDATS